MTFFLKLKHWQLFLLLVGIPIALEFFTIGFILTADDFSSGLQRFLRAFPVLMMVYIAILFGWMWSVGVFLSKKLPNETPMPIGLFK